MGRDTPRYFVTVRGHHFWQPSSKLRAKGWPSKPLGADRGAAVAAAIALNEQVDEWRRGGSPARGEGKDAARRAVPGTVYDLILRYQASSHYPENANTIRQYDYACRYLAKWIGPLPVQAITPRMCVDRYAQLRKVTPGAAGAFMRIGQALFAKARFLADPGHPLFVARENNPFAALEIQQGAPSAVRWSRAERDATIEAAGSIGLYSIGMAIALNWWLGQREGDILALPPNALQGMTLTIGQSKTAVNVHLPVSIVPQIQAARAAAEKRQADIEAERAAKRHEIGGNQPPAKITSITHLLINEATGKPWDEHAFRKKIREIRKVAAWKALIENRVDDALRLFTLTFMHLRHTAVCEMFEAGCTIPEIAAVTGHTLNSVHQILERYGLRTRALAATAFQRRLDKEQGDGGG